MPEGPETKIVADVISKGTGKKFVTAQIIENVSGITHRFTNNGIPRLSELQIPWTLGPVRTQGKLIYFSIYTTAGTIIALSTLGMSGSWGWGLNGHKHARLSFIAEEGPDLTFVDPRCMGSFRLKTPKEADELIEKIGWDLLHSPAPDDLWQSFQKATKLKNKPIGQALLDQSLFSSLGNIYKNEVMYINKIDPRMLVKDVPFEKWMSINLTAHDIMQASYRQGGASVESFTADGKKGTYQFSLKIYGKKYCPEGHQVWSFKQGERTTWFCKICQI
jgi:formamidopyrimidine-DNA glycosylase